MMKIAHGRRQHHDIPGRKSAFQDYFPHGDALVRRLWEKQAEVATALPDNWR
jgi:hypothetical protein